MTGSRFASAYHAPVLVAEVRGLLTQARRVLDGTLGGGGHALALLEAGAAVVGLDRDPEAITAARERLVAFEARGRFTAVHASFADDRRLAELGGEPFDGVLLDLGVSSRQFDDDTRGFSFREGAPLDMRMDGSHAPTAAALLNEASEPELTRVFRDFGDEPKGGRLAREVVRRRANRAFATSSDFVGAIRAVLGPRSGPGDFARLFQALRIAVNGELGALAGALPALRDRLSPGGVMAVIAYHSGEDRIVKHAFREWSRSCVCPPKQVVCTCRGRPLGELLTRRAVTAAPAELAGNVRARSAHLRAWRKGHAAGGD